MFPINLYLKNRVDDYEDLPGTSHDYEKEKEKAEDRCCRFVRYLQDEICFKRFCEPIRLLCLIWSILLLITGALTCIMLCQKVWGNHHPKAFLSEVLSPNLTLIIMEGQSIVYSLLGICLLLLIITRNKEMDSLIYPRFSLNLLIASFMISDTISIIAVISNKLGHHHPYQCAKIASLVPLASLQLFICIAVLAVCFIIWKLAFSVYNCLIPAVRKRSVFVEV